MMDDIHSPDAWPWLTMAQINRQFGVPRATLTLAIRSGRLPAKKIDSRWYVPGAEFRAWYEDKYRPHK